MAEKTSESLSMSDSNRGNSTNDKKDAQINAGHRVNRTLDTKYGVCQLWHRHGTPAESRALRTSPINRTRNRTSKEE